MGASLVGMGALLLPQGPFRKAIAIPPLIAIAYNIRRHSTGQPAEDYLSAVNVCMTMCKFVDFCVLDDPEQSCLRVWPDGTTETTQEIQSMSMWQKLRWNFDLFATMRGIGWNWKVKNVDEVPKDISRR